jgi:hypothetical protein
MSTPSVTLGRPILNTGLHKISGNFLSISREVTVIIPIFCWVLMSSFSRKAYMYIEGYYNASWKMGYCVDWLHLVQDKDHWRAPVNTVLKLKVP